MKKALVGIGIGMIFSLLSNSFVYGATPIIDVTLKELKGQMATILIEGSFKSMFFNGVKVTEEATTLTISIPSLPYSIEWKAFGVKNPSQYDVPIKTGHLVISKMPKAEKPKEVNRYAGISLESVKRIVKESAWDVNDFQSLADCLNESDRGKGKGCTDEEYYGASLAQARVLDRAYDTYMIGKQLKLERENVKKLVNFLWAMSGSMTCLAKTYGLDMESYEYCSRLFDIAYSHALRELE